jgi:hypothetical protein
MTLLPGNAWPAEALALLRTAVRYPTEVLRAAGAPAVERAKFSRERFPDDHSCAEGRVSPAVSVAVDVDLVVVSRHTERSVAFWGDSPGWPLMRARGY